MRAVEGAGVLLAVEERGEGGPLAVVVHGLASDRLAWTGALDRLAAAGGRAVAYDRRGYGESGAPQPYGATTVEEQAEDLVALLDDLGGGPAVLLGDGFGALVVLDLLKRHPARARAAVLAAPPLFAFVPEASDVLSGQRSMLEEALREGGPPAAIARWLGGRVDEAALARAQASAGAFFADFAGLSSWPVTRRELRALRHPAVVVTHPGTPPHILAAADALAGLLPDAARDRDGDAVAAAIGLL